MFAAGWGSDIIADAIAALGFEFAAINPGASFRGLHDSFVNRGGNPIPLVVCLHEEHAVAFAHGWSKVTGRPALSIVHSNVGLMHAIMAVYNAWVDRAPVVLLNATGPLDATQRRPWIEWIHTAQDHGALVRNFTKWDDLPLSAGAAADSIAEATFLAAAEPQGPTFVCLDVGAQETVASDRYTPRKLVPLAPVVPDAALLEQVARRLAGCERVVLLAGRVSRSEVGWQERIALAERLNAAVITDIKTAAAFPVDHQHHAGDPGYGLDPEQQQLIEQTDAILALDWIDLDAVLRQKCIDNYVVAASLDHAAARGWVKNTYRRPVTNAMFPVSSDTLVTALLAQLPTTGRRSEPWWVRSTAGSSGEQSRTSLSASAYATIAEGLAAIRRHMPVAVTRYPLGWPGHLVSFAHPLDYLGRDGGEGLASGPGIAVGVAQALNGSGRLPVAIIGDGDLMMGVSALWTAANQKLPLLVVVAANGVYGNDVVHQEQIAIKRGRPTTNKWAGQRIDGPRIDIAGLARDLGAGFAQRADGEDIVSVMLSAARAAASGQLALVEVDIRAS